MAIVVDEYGGTAGILTLEDLVEDRMDTLTEEMFDSISIIEVDIDGLKYINDTVSLM